MKKSFLLVALTLCYSIIFAQTQPSDNRKVEQKVVKATDKTLNTTTETAQKATQINQNMQTISQNVKEIVKIFEPFTVQFKKKGKVEAGDGELQAQTTYNIEITENNASANEQNSSNEQMPNGNYNSDGTANLGTQNHKSYGNYLDMNKGEILDNITAPLASQSVDLIFTATSWADKTLYAFFSPYYAKNNTGAKKYNFGIKYKRNEPHPATNWQFNNESQVALTNLTAEQFEQFSTADQLETYIKQLQNFKECIEIYSPIERKVVAIKTKMDNRTAYGLLLVSEQFGTVGENSFVKVKLKVAGKDMDGDGLPD